MPPLRGFRNVAGSPYPRALPGAALDRPFGAPRAGWSRRPNPGGRAPELVALTRVQRLDSAAEGLRTMMSYPRQLVPHGGRLRTAAAALMLLALAGCGGSSLEPELVWGQHGVQPGDFHRPRAIAIDVQDRL